MRTSLSRDCLIIIDLSLCRDFQGRTQATNLESDKKVTILMLRLSLTTCQKSSAEGFTGS